MGQYVSAKRGRWGLGMQGQNALETTEDAPGLSET